MDFSSLSERRKEACLIYFQTEQRKAEQRKYGIEYDDDYDYLQHLKDPCAPPEKYAVQVNPQEEEDDEDFEDEQAEEEEEEDKVKFTLFDKMKRGNEFGIKKTVTRFNLPSTVFESKTTNEIGMLNLDVPDAGNDDRKALR